MKYSKRVLKILTALSYKGIGRAWVASNLQKDLPVGEILEILKAKGVDGILTPEAFEYTCREIEQKIQELSPYVDGAIAFGEEGFPKTYNTKGIKPGDTPVVLFYKGDIGLLQGRELPVAVIGLLTPKEQIEQAERMVVRELVAQGAVVVSGLAQGCDSIAHLETLEQGGGTVAILPSTLKKIVPATNHNLAQRIVAQGGLLLTEYYEEAKGKKEQTTRYIERDRLQALFSSCVLLAASYAENKEGLDCGSRHAMGKAYDYGIARAVIYNEVKHRDERMYDLNRQISQGDNSVLVLDSANYVRGVTTLMRKQENSLFR